MRPHYAWIIGAVTFLGLVVASGVRAAPGVLIVPLEGEFAWDRASVSLAVAVSLVTFGLGAPLAGGLVDRFGARRVVTAGLALIALGLAALVGQRELWHFYALWGVAVGVGTGVVSNVVGTVIAYRWFRKHRGLVVGLFAGAGSAGQLVFIPGMVAAALAFGWRGSVLLVALAAGAALVAIAVLLRDRPEDVGVRPYGDDGTADAAEQALERGTTPLRIALRARDFWLLAATFFICGYTSNGLIGTHLIPHAVEHGFTEVAAAGAFGVMGAMNVVGTLASGWLSDRYDPRKLLAIYYGLRAASLAALPLILDVPMLMMFAVVYGLDWIATVPPTAKLIATIFGRASLGTIYGWVFFGHMLGAALAAYSGGLFRTLFGDYHLVFVSAAILGFVAVALALRITPPRRAPAVAAAPAY